MFDWGDKKNETTNILENHQATLQTSQGSAGAAISNSEFKNSNLTLVSNDPRAALAAIEASSQASNVAAIAALASSKVSTAGLDTANRALNLAGVSTIGAQSTVENVLGFMRESQLMTADLIKSAVGTAEDIALRAAPVSPGSYGVIMEQQQAGVSKSLIIGAVLIAAIAFYYRSK